MKIAVYASLFFTNPMSNDLQTKTYIGPNNLLGYVKLTNIMFKSCKKYFLKNHDVEFIVVTNVPNLEEFGLDTELIKIIKTDYKVDVVEHARLMKILGVEFIDTTKYDKMYLVDHDSIFINEVVDEDLLPYDMVAQRHWAKEDATYGRTWFNNARVLPIEEWVTFDPVAAGFEWVMGNFFGGNSELMKDMMEKSKELHNRWVQIENLPTWPFYSLHPDELFVGKYIYENVENYKLLDCIFDLEPEIDRETCNPPAENQYCLPGWGIYQRADRTKQYWLSDFKNNESLYPNITLAKLLHGTKTHFELVDKIAPYYI